MSNIDLKQKEREQMRWLILYTLNAASDIGTYEGLILSTIQSVLPEVTQLDLRKAMSYLEDRNLIKITRQPSGTWFAVIARHGTDVVEYTVSCEPGIARPPRYW